MRVFDSHVHLDCMSPDARRAPARAEEYAALVPGIRPEDTRSTLAAPPPRALLAAALHPWHAGPPEDDDAERRWQDLRSIAADPRVVAVGETGLDHYRFTSEDERADAETWFRRHVSLAIELGKPLVIHCVRAHADCQRVLSELRPPAGGAVHAFSGSPEEADAYARLGFAVGIGPAVTRERSKRVRRAAASVPLEHLLVETDAPYIAAGERGRDEGRADDIIAVIEAVAELRGMTPEQVAEATWDSAAHLFGQPRPLDS